MRRNIATILTSTVLSFAGLAGADGDHVTVYMCTDLSGDDCTSSEVPQTITENRDGDSLDVDGTLERNEAIEDDRSFTVYVDAHDEGATNVCKIEAHLAFDPDTLVPDGSTNLGVASSVSGGVTTLCNVEHDKTAPSGWPGLTSVYICKIAETDWLYSPEGDLVLDDGGAAAEMSAEFNVKKENSVAGARTGLGAVVLDTVLQFIEDEEGDCIVDDTAVVLAAEGEVRFTVEDTDTSVGAGDRIACGLKDIDGDVVCEDAGTPSEKDNCSGFWGSNWTQADRDGDGYGNVCDSDVNGDCIGDGDDADDISVHDGDSFVNSWCGHPTPGSCTGGPHDDVFDVTGDLEVDDDDVNQANAHPGTIGPTENTSASPEPSCS